MLDAVLAVEDDRLWGRQDIELQSSRQSNHLRHLAWPALFREPQLSASRSVNLNLSGRPNGLWSKPSEVVRAVATQRQMLSKDRSPLGHYLNRLPFGDRKVEIPRASEEYFGHPASELSVSEAALRAGIPQGAECRRASTPSAPGLRAPKIRPPSHADDGSHRRSHLSVWLWPRCPSSAPRCRALGELARTLRCCHRAGMWRQGSVGAERAASCGSISRLDASEAGRDRHGASCRPASLLGESRTARAVVLANSTGEVPGYVGAARSGEELTAGPDECAPSR